MAGWTMLLVGLRQKNKVWVNRCFAGPKWISDRGDWFKSFLVNDDRIQTAPSSRVLSGLTREMIFDIAKS